MSTTETLYGSRGGNLGLPESYGNVLYSQGEGYVITYCPECGAALVGEPSTVVTTLSNLRPIGSVIQTHEQWHMDLETTLTTAASDIAVLDSNMQKNDVNLQEVKEAAQKLLAELESRE